MTAELLLAGQLLSFAWIGGQMPRHARYPLMHRGWQGLPRTAKGCSHAREVRKKFLRQGGAAFRWPLTGTAHPA